MDMLKKLNTVLSAAQKKKVMGLLVLIIIGATLESLSVSMILPVVTAVVEPDNAVVVYISKLLGVETIEQLVLIMIGVLIAMFIIKNLYLLFLYYVQNTFITGSQYKISRDLLEVFFNKPYEYYLNANTSDVLRTVYSDTTGVYSLLLELINFTSELVIAAFLGCLLLFVDFTMTVFICLLIFGVTGLVAVIYRPKMGKIGVEARHRQIRMYNSIIQSIQSIKDVKIFAKEESFIEEYENNGKIFYRLERNQKVLSSAPKLLIETVCICGVLGYLGVVIAMGGSVMGMLPQLSAFALAAARLMPAASRMSTYLANAAYYKPTLDYVYDHVDMPQNVIKEQSPKTIGRALNIRMDLKSEISVQNLTYKYPASETYIFKDASMIIPVGKSVGIVGKSGAGKTTLVDIMLGLLDSQSGKVYCDGVDILTNYAGWLHNIGYIPQTINLMDDTIRANVAFGIPSEKVDEKRVWEVLEEAQLTEFVQGQPEGILTEIGERGIRMSGGQRQRLGIARALYHNPEMLILDEATSALDNDTEAAIMDAIHRFQGKKTMLIIAHRLKTIEGCDMVFRVENGSILRER